MEWEVGGEGENVVEREGEREREVEGEGEVGGGRDREGEGGGRRGLALHKQSSVSLFLRVVKSCRMRQEAPGLDGASLTQRRYLGWG